jgi:hypothetical protein
MNALKAHVKGGQIVLDEPTELSEGAELLIVRVDAGMDDLERAALERAIEDGAADFEAGRFENARDFALQLANKSK